MGTLVLTRHVGEAIMIGHDITVTVTDVDRGQVKIAVQAPDDVEIWRDTIYRRIQQEKIDANRGD